MEGAVNDPGGASLKLAPKYHALFRAIVLDGWEMRHEEAAEARRTREKMRPLEIAPKSFEENW